MGLWADPRRAIGRCESGAKCGYLPNQPGSRPLNARSAASSPSKSLVRSAGVRWCRSDLQKFRLGLPSCHETSRLRPPATHSAFCGGCSTTPSATERSTGIRSLASACRRFKAMTHAHLPTTSSGSSPIVSMRPETASWSSSPGYCGLRWGELAALRWSDVDLEKGTLRVVRAYSEEAPRGELSPVKDHQSRTVPIPRVVLEELARFKAQKPEGLVFPSANSTPLRNRNFRRDVFDPAVEVGPEHHSAQSP